MIAHKNDMPNLYAGVGCLIITWSAVEQATDVACNVVFHHCGGNSIRKDLPKFTKHKNKFLIDASKRLQELSDFKADTLRITGSIANLMDIRHDFAHSYIEHYGAVDGVYRFIRLDASETAHNERQWNFDARDFPALLGKIQDLSEDAAKYSSALLERFAPDA